MKVHPGQTGASVDELDGSGDLSRVGSGAVYVMRETTALDYAARHLASGGEGRPGLKDPGPVDEVLPRIREAVNSKPVLSQTSVREGKALSVDPESLQDQLEGSSLDERLTTIATAFKDSRLAVVTSSGPASLIVIHTLHQLGIRLPVVFVDTLHHFPETLEHLERVRAMYDLDLRVYRAFDTREEFEAKYGPRLWERDLDLYQEVSKVEPFRRARSELDAWITGRRREQGQKRAELPIIEWGDQSKINPLADWNRTQVWRFILENEIPYNPLHDQGFASIGDAPLTTAIGDGEAERDGRWRGTSRTECGIHE